ncbi:MAG TPA: sialate O-acetylesterase [Polyangiaceae bacterium]|nr:sialate O-acetylesterase [Polyangiaceae bacterium]
MTPFLESPFVTALSRIAFALLPLVLVGNARADDAVRLPPRGEFHLFLLAGQSNMAGRGEVEPSDREPIPHVLALDAAGNWVPARDPIHWDKPSAGVGLARSFAVEYLKHHPGVTVGFIPAACGGSPISTWAPGQYFDQTHSHPYDDALTRTRRALQAGILRGILWHQGESDTQPELAPSYEASLTALIARLRRELGAPRVPFVIGQLGQFAAVPWNEPTRAVDAAHRNVAAAVPLAALVSSHGLASNPDNIHFSAAALREFGRRYAVEFDALEREAAARH